MPELPEVETVCRGLAKIFEGETLTNIVLRRADLRFPFPKDFCKLLTGKQIINVSRRAKYILIMLRDETILVCHLGMSGSFSVFYENIPPVHKHDHVIFFTSNRKEIRYHDPRRFGFMTLTSQNEIEKHPIFRKLGPEPINPNLKGAFILELLKNRVGPIKNILLNQSVIAGLGNIYVSEILHKAGISPNRKAKDIKKLQATRLAEAISEVLSAAIKAGGTSLKDYRTPLGELGFFQNEFRVYGRTGQNCMKCIKNVEIKKIFQANRSTFYCPQCQR